MRCEEIDFCNRFFPPFLNLTRTIFDFRFPCWFKRGIVVLRYFIIFSETLNTPSLRPSRGSEGLILIGREGPLKSPDWLK